MIFSGLCERDKNLAFARRNGTLPVTFVPFLFLC
jgi:hypothetical protein